MPRSFALAAANSSSLSCPLCRMLLSWLSWAERSSGGGGAASACCWSLHRACCRRLTRLDTAVAGPATTAVRAMPRMSPMAALRSRADRAAGIGQHADDRGRWDPGDVDQLAAGSPAGTGEPRRPGVLEDEKQRRGVRLQIVADVGDVVRVEQPIAGLAV